MPDRDSHFKFDRNTETLEVLAGERPKAMQQAAVRIEDLAGLLQFPALMQPIASAGGSPTQAEFDALVRELKKVFAALTVTSNALRDRLTPK